MAVNSWISVTSVTLLLIFGEYINIFVLGCLHNALENGSVTVSCCRSIFGALCVNWFIAVGVFQACLCVTHWLCDTIFNRRALVLFLMSLDCIHKHSNCAAINYSLWLKLGSITYNNKHFYNLYFSKLITCSWLEIAA